MAFDSRADGYGLGEGVGTIILKPLSAAVRDGDTIRALVRGTGLGHDGHTPGLTYPSATAQELLIRKTYLASGLDPKDTVYSESHGTGTQAGDLIECTAIAAAFETQQRDSPFYVGAIKPNLGHLEGGSGIASVIKSVLILESGVIPPNATLEEINPKISPAWNLQFPTSCIPWPTSGIRRSSISSYGISGTNAHCILDDAYHYLQQRRITARHRTRETVPSSKEIQTLVAEVFDKYKTDTKVSKSDAPAPKTSGVSTNGANGVNRVNGIDGTNDTNGVKGIKRSNGVHGMNGTNGFNGSNGLNGSNGVNGAKSNHTTPDEISQQVSGSPIIFIISAFDQERLERVIAHTKDYVTSRILDFESSPKQALNDLAYSLSEKRSRLPWKSFALCSSVDELQDKLPKLPSKAIKSRSGLRIGFVFTGQGAQYAKMGQQLLVYPVFRQSLEAAGAYFKSLGSDWSLLEELSRETKDSKISKSAFAHPLSCAVQIALLDLLLSWGVVPHRVAGHSSGEIAAAYCAGKISRKAAWKVAYFRGHVLRPGESKPPFTGGMIAVGLDEEPLRHLLKKVHARFPGGALSIACYNSLLNHTVSGDLDMVDALKEMLDEQGVFNRKLKVEHAAHSAHMEYFSAEYDELLGELPSKHRLHFDHTVHMFSTLTGRLLDDACSPREASHWRDSMVCPVKFTDALSSMCFDPTPTDSSSTCETWVDVILEVGPHPAMQSAAKEIIGSNADIPYFGTLNRKDDGLSSLLETIGNLVVRGAPINLDKVNRATNPSLAPKLMVDLPPYPFNHEEQSLYESRLIKNTRLREFPRHDLFGAPVPDWNPNSPRWRHFLRVAENPWLKEHVVSIPIPILT
jgi:acyl transferase domain-containing protein